MANEVFFAVIGKQVDNPNMSVTEFEGVKLLEPFEGAGICPMEGRVMKMEAESVAHGKRTVKHFFPSTGATNTVFVKEAAWKES